MRRRLRAVRCSVADAGREPARTARSSQVRELCLATVEPGLRHEIKLSRRGMTKGAVTRPKNGKVKVDYN